MRQVVAVALLCGLGLRLHGHSVECGDLYAAAALIVFGVGRRR